MTREAREFTDEEKEKMGLKKTDCCGILGVFGLDNPMPKNAGLMPFLLMAIGESKNGDAIS